MAADKPKGRVVVDEVRAPVIFADTIETYGVSSDVVRIVLSSDCVMPRPDGGVAAESIVVCHLRLTKPAAEALVRSIVAALEKAAPPGPDDKIN